jgi:hypothetical protein
VAVDHDGPRRRIDDAANDADQRRLAGAVRAEESEDLAAAYLEIDPFKRLKSGGVGLAEILDADDGCRRNGGDLTGNNGRRKAGDGRRVCDSMAACRNRERMVTFPTILVVKEKTRGKGNSEEIMLKS